MHPEAGPADGRRRGGLRAPATDDGVAYAGLVLNRKGLDRALQTSPTEIHVAYPVTDTFAARNQNLTVEEGRAHGARRSSRATRPEAPTATISVAFGCPFEGQVDPGLVIEHAHRMAAAGADEIDPRGHDRRRRPAPGQGARRRGAAARQARRPAPAQHAQHGLRERRRGPRVRRDDLRRFGRRPRRLPVRAARDRQHRHRGPHLPAPQRGRRDRHRSRPPLIEVAHWLSETMGKELPGSRAARG